MALYTEKLIMNTLEDMLEEMPFDKITVSALVRRAGISNNTFYYHYQDIYALLDAWFNKKVEYFVPDGVEPIEWKDITKDFLRQCKAHPQIIYHLFDCLSRDRLERYVFSLADDVFYRLVRQYAGERRISEANLRSISSFCRYAYIGFVMQFFWGRMTDDIDESVDRLGTLFERFLVSAFDAAE